METRTTFVVHFSYQTISWSEEVGDGVRVATQTCHVDWQETSRTSLENAGSVRDERLDDGGVSMASCDVQRSVPLFVFHINSRS
jgi:hypothetical protein